MRTVLRLIRWAPRDIRAAGGVRPWLFYMAGPGPLLMSWLRKRWTLWKNPQARIEFNGPVYLGPGFSLHVPRGGTFIVGPGVEFRRGFRAELGPDARVEIGALCAFTHYVTLSCLTSIDIGPRAMIAQGALVVDGGHRFRDLDIPVNDQGFDLRPIHIGADAIVHSKCTIIADIGERAVIGANAVVTRPIPPFCVAVGVPARVIEYFGPPGQEPAERSASSTATSG